MSDWIHHVCHSCSQQLLQSADSQWLSLVFNLEYLRKQNPEKTNKII